MIWRCSHQRRKSVDFPLHFPILFSVFCPPRCSPGGATVQAQPHQPDGECNRVPADGVRCGGQTSAPPLLVQRQPASSPNVRCVNTPTQVIDSFTQQCSCPPADAAATHTCTCHSLASSSSSFSSSTSFSSSSSSSSSPSSSSSSLSSWLLTFWLHIT